jgi:hypothetical protein
VLQTSDWTEVSLAIKPGTWFRRGDQLIYLEDLGVGNYVRTESVPLFSGQEFPQITILNSNSGD